MRLNLKSNPPWVTKVIASNYKAMEQQVPPEMLPQFEEVSADRQVIVATIKEYGCGAYGCVIPTLYPKIVLKITTDQTEADFARLYANQLVAPICVRYHYVMPTTDKYKERAVHLLWRDSADSVGKIDEIEGDRAETLITRQHSAAAAAYKAAFMNETKYLKPLIEAWVSVCQVIADQDDVPSLKHIGAGMVQIWNRQRILFGDIHGGNLGLVDGTWLITDPGNIAVIDESALVAPPASDLPPDVIISGVPAARGQVLVHGRLHIRPELMPISAAEDIVYRSMTEGYSVGDLDFGAPWSLRTGVPPVGAKPNTLYIVSPERLARHGIYAAEVDDRRMASVAKQWRNGDSIPAIGVNVDALGDIYISDDDSGNEALHLSATENEPVPLLVRSNLGWHRPKDVTNISNELFDLIPEGTEKGG